MILALISTFFCIALFYITGNFLLYVTKTNTYYDAFINCIQKLIIGMLASVAICALIITRGNSIMWGIPIIGGFCLYTNKYISKNAPHHHNFFEKKDLLPLCLFTIVTLLVFTFQALHFYNTPYNNIPHPDYNFYGALADLMYQTGKENSQLVSNIYLENKTATPYHYFEIWLALFCSFLGRINTTECLFVIIYPIFFAFYSISLILIAKSISKKKISLIIGFATIFFIPLTYWDFNIPFFKILTNPSFALYHPLTEPKTLVIGIFANLSILTYIKCKPYFLHSILIIPIISNVTAPAIATSLFLYLSFFFLSKKERNSPIMKNNIFAFYTLFLFIFLFYKFQSQGIETGDFSVENILPRIKLYTIFKSCIKLFLFIFLFYLPLLLPILFSLFSKKDIKSYLYKDFIPLFVFSLFLILSGFIISQIFTGITNSSQLYTIPTLYIIPIILLTILFYIESTKNILQISYILIFVLLYSLYSLIVFRNTEGSFSITQTTEIKNDTLYLYQTTHYSNITGANFNPSFIVHSYIHDNRLKRYNTSINPTKKDGAFADFYNKQNKKEQLDSIQFVFLKKHNIKCLIVQEKENIPQIILPYIDTIFIDSKTKERTIFFSLEKP